MEATPVRWISARRAGIASPQSYVFHRWSRRARVRVRSPALEEVGSMTDPKVPFQCSQRAFGALRLPGSE